MRKLAPSLWVERPGQDLNLRGVTQRFSRPPPYRARRPGQRIVRRTSGRISIPASPSGDNTYGAHRFEEAVQVAVEILPGHREQNLEMHEKATGIDLLRRLGLAPDAHILVRGEIPIAADESLPD